MLYVQHIDAVPTVRGCLLCSFAYMLPPVVVAVVVAMILFKSLLERQMLWNWIRSTSSDLQHLQEASRQLIGCGMLIRSTLPQITSTVTNATFGKTN